MRRATLSSNSDWTALCVEATVGGLSALAAVPCQKLVDDPTLRRLLRAVAAEASSAARKDGQSVSGRLEDLAARDCRRSPRRTHPWQRALRRGRKTGAEAVFGPILKAARRAGTPVPKLAVMAEVLSRLDRDR